MFQGFTDETFDFLTAIGFNNNTEFFHGNHDWYLRAVREPCLQLAEALSGVAEEVDEAIERRPNRVVSRINRDLRYSRDKSPYRDRMWLSFQRPAEVKYTAPGLYFEITPRGASCGLGFYEAERLRMNGLRRLLRVEPEAFLSLWQPLNDDYVTMLDGYKRMKLPEGLDPALRDWYRVRRFYLDREMDDFRLLKSPELVDWLAGCFRQLAPFYRYIAAIEPVQDADQTRRDPVHAVESAI